MDQETYNKIAESTERTPEAVYKAIADVSAGLAKEGIAKARSNTQQGWKFRGIDDVYNALAPLLPECGLVIIPRCVSRMQTERKSGSGGALFSVVVEAEFDFVSVKDGSMHTARVFGEAMDSGDKATSKAMSVAYREVAIKTFSIPIEGDNDADATTHRVVPEQKVATDTQKPAESNQFSGNSVNAVPRPTLVQPKPAPTAAQASPTLGSPTLPGVLITAVDIASQGVSSKSGKPYKLWRVSFSMPVVAPDGTKLPAATTFDDALAATADGFRAAGTRVSVKIEPGSKKGTYNVAEFSIQQ